jgi:hypothetical protein
MRIFPEQQTERLAVFRVTYDGEALIRGDAGAGDRAGPIFRVDLRVTGKPFTVWIRKRCPSDPFCYGSNNLPMRPNDAQLRPSAGDSTIRQW